MVPRSARPRKLINILAAGISVISATTAVFLLFWILFVVFQRGFKALNWSFFVNLPTPPGMPSGGLANAILGSIIIVVVASLIAIPVGIMAGVYLSEFARQSRFGDAVRFSVNMLISAPSIVVGLLVWGTVVIAMGSFSGLAGSIALAIIMLPVVTRTTEEMLKLVPDTLREAVLGMGAPRWRAMHIIFLAAKNGLVTGILLAVARVSGETAPLLFTALNSPYWPTSLTEPMANLPVTIFNYAMSPYEDWQAKAWGASLLITLAVLALSISARALFRTKREWG